jgi:putative NADH-flavin reductase
MIIAVFGATGDTGRLVVQYALEAGHDVQALIRTPSKLPAVKVNYWWLCETMIICVLRKVDCTSWSILLSGFKLYSHAMEEKITTAKLICGWCGVSKAQ